MYVSAVSIAEIAIKSSLGKLRIDGDVIGAVDDAGFELLSFSAGAAARLKDLPLLHKDPFDRMLIVHSNETGFPILTDDGKFSLYDCVAV